MNNIADVTMTGEATNNAFGFSVSDAGDVNGDGFADVYVGAYGFSSSKGRAYLYYGGTNMNNAVDIYMTGEDTFNYFGYSVSGGGDVNGDGFADMISGAYGYNSNTGRAYVFTNTMTGEDIPDVVMTGAAHSADAFGRNVSYAGDVNRDGYNDVIVADENYNTFSGRVYIFYGGSIMDNIADVILEGETTSHIFGRTVSSAGDVNGDGFDDVIVGASFGKTYIYFGATAMDNVADVIINNNVSIFYGSSVSSAGDINNDGYKDVIVTQDNASTGWAYVYFGDAAMNNVADVIITGISSNFGFGVSTSGAGDVNYDGYDDIIVGANRLNNHIGVAYIYYGGQSMNSIADVTMTGENSEDHFGTSVSKAGDLNMDGYADVIVGASGYNGNTGRTYIFYGGSPMNNIADVTLTGEYQENYFGYSVSTAGDVNGDEYDDVIVGAKEYAARIGRGYIFFGSSLMDNIADITMSGEAADNNFGNSVSGAGDVNGDGHSDVIVGMSAYAGITGKAYVYFASPPDNRKKSFSLRCNPGNV